MCLCFCSDYGFGKWDKGQEDGEDSRTLRKKKKEKEGGKKKIPMHLILNDSYMISFLSPFFAFVPLISS